METSERENMQTKYSVLTHKIDVYFCEYKLAIEIDEKNHSNRRIDYEIKRQKAIEEKLDCIFIRIDSDEENFNIFKPQTKIFRHIKEANKKLLKLKLKKILPTS